MTETSLPPAYFDALYAREPDPWRFATSEYEQAKYAATLEALPRARFASAFEAGCSIGVLTAQLARRCDALLAVDVADAALDQARRACADQPQVRFARMQAPSEWPAGRFDLIVLSEVLYYMSREDVARTADATRASLVPGGLALLVHWTGPTNYPLTADQAAETFFARATLTPVAASRTAEYRLDLLSG